jgi:ABC-2 type transport system permease protein
MTMPALFRMEVLKLRTMRVAFGLLGAITALTALFTSLEASRAGKVGAAVGPLSSSAGLGRVTTTTGWSMLFAAVLGVLSACGEHRHDGATLTYLAEPRRDRVLIAKALAGSGFGALFGLASGVVATVVGLAFAKGRGDAIALRNGALIGHIAGAVLGAALFGAIGVCLGSLLRSQLAGVIAIFFWGLVIESIVGGLFTATRPYLPYTAATTLAGIKLGSASFGGSSSGGTPLPFLAAAGLVVGVALVTGLVAARVSLPHDVQG